MGPDPRRDPRLGPACGEPDRRDRRHRTPRRPAVRRGGRQPTCDARDSAGHQASPASRSWSLDRRARGAIMRRPVGLRFDLDGIGKGWLADRSLGRLGRHPAAVVDADGDVAVAPRAGDDLVVRRGGSPPRRPRPRDDAAEPARPPRRSPGRAFRPRDVRHQRPPLGEGRRPDPPPDRSADRTVGRDRYRPGDRARRGRPAKRKPSRRRPSSLARRPATTCSTAPAIDGAILLTDRDELVIHPATLRWLA